MSSTDSLADLFLQCCRREKAVLPGLELSESEKARDLDLYRRLVKIDKLKESKVQSENPEGSLPRGFR